MARQGCLFGCVFVTVCLSYNVLGQVGSLCRPNERLLTCGGCQKTCKDPAPVCSAVCATGCFCNEGEVRNDTGHCVQLSECPPVLSTYLQTSEPRSTDTECPENEEYRFCEPCNKTCDNPNPVCPAQCARGCFCVEDLVRERDGRCVKQEHCSNLKKNESSTHVQPVTYQLTCGLHQTYRRCQKCERTCSDPRPVCRTPCSTGCFCDEGYFRSPNGQCVKLENCPKAEVSMGAHEPGVEDCQPDEVYLQCGWCEPSCSAPRPRCAAGACTRGCLCRPPLLRHHSGRCVPERDCLPQKCSSANEEYVCRYGCEVRCDPQACLPRPRRCALGCHCRLGLLRDATGKCVTPDKCATHPNNSTYKFFDDIAPNTHFIDVRTYIEAANLNKTKMQVKGEATDAKPEGAPPKTFKDVISMAQRFYKEFPNAYGPNTPLYREVDLRLPHRFDRNQGIETSYRKMDIIPGNTTIKANDNLLTELVNITSEEAVNASEVHIGVPPVPFKEINLNALSEFLNVMKDMMPDMNFTILDYPLW